MTTTNEANLLKLFDAARRVSVPLLAVRTADQNAAIAEIRKSPQAGDKFALLQWDIARGITPLHGNDAGPKAMADAKPPIKSNDTVGFVEAMMAAQLLPRGAVLFVHNVHRQVWSQEPASTAAAIQAVSNLRDAYKKNFRMVVLLGPLGYALPSELEHDVVIAEHALPSPDVLRETVIEIHNSAKLPHPSADALEKAVDAGSGLSQFAAEQVYSMSLTEKGMDLDSMWERKRVAIEQTPGLSVWRGKERFSDLVGLDAIKEHLLERKTSRTPIGCVLWLDEIDKVLANVEADTSGVRLDQLRTLLTEMENNEWNGLVGVGVAGGGKSAIAKAFGAECGVPTIALDLGGMESKYVGESEGNLRRAMAIIKSIGRGHCYVIATSNNASVMRPELQRRFTDGMWMFDIMTSEERAAAWAFYLKKYSLAKQKMPDDDGWTGAEIRNCARRAWDTGKSLRDCARFIVPMSRSRGEAIEELRRYAHGKLLDATRGGAYGYNPAPMRDQLRAIQLPGATLDQLANMKES